MLVPKHTFDFWLYLYITNIYIGVIDAAEQSATY